MILFVTGNGCETFHVGYKKHERLWATEERWTVIEEYDDPAYKNQLKTYWIMKAYLPYLLSTLF